MKYYYRFCYNKRSGKVTRPTKIDTAEHSCSHGTVWEYLLKTYDLKPWQESPNYTLVYVEVDDEEL